MSPRKEQILTEACALLAREGCGAFTLRAVARASGLTLGALQYHYRTRAALLQALTDFLARAYHDGFAAFRADTRRGPHDLHALLDYLAVESTTVDLQVHRLFPQLWAMALVEPPVQQLLDGIYTPYLDFIEEALQAHGVAAPRAEALLLLSALEGLTLFVDPGRRWEPEAQGTLAALHTLLEVRYGIENPRP